MTKLTAAQARHIEALTDEFQTMETLRKINGFCNLTTCHVLRKMGLAENHDNGHGVTIKGLEWRLTAEGMKLKKQ